MKILLIQNMLYVPALGGANKGNRELLESLAQRGHTCVAAAPSTSPHGPHSRHEFQNELKRRNIEITSSAVDVDVFHIAGVEVHAFFDSKKIASNVSDLITATQPDCVLVGADDPTQSILESALTNAPGRVILLTRATFYLPFGPSAFLQSPERARDIAKCRAIVCNSRYVANYVRENLPTDAGTPEIVSLPLPVMGMRADLLPREASFERGFVTMINPCAIKGISIFLEMARRFPRVEFAVAPTWGSTPSDRHTLKGFANIRVLTPDENIQSILTQTRILLVPSLCDEAFGRIVIEAMLQGIPVLASNVGGLPEAKLGVDYLLPVRPIGSYQLKIDENHLPIPNIPEQDCAPWETALGELLADRTRYEENSAASRRAAVDFVTSANFSDFEKLLLQIASTPGFNNSQSRPAQSEFIKTLSPSDRTALALKALQTKRRPTSAASVRPPLRLPGETRFPASPRQKSLVYLQSAHPENTAYNAPLVIDLSGRLDLPCLQKSVDTLVKRHESLRTTFEINAEPICQIINPPRPVQWEFADAPASVAVSALTSQYSRKPFDLRNDQLIRAALIRFAPEHHLLILTIHHLACDAQSLATLFRELSQSYEGLDLSNSPPQYADFSLREQKSHDLSLAYWREELAGADFSLHLPIDQVATDSCEGARHSLTLSSGLSERLNELARREGVSSFMLYLAAWNAFLHELTGQNDISIGCPVNLRSPVFENAVGDFVNTLALRSCVNNKTTFLELLTQTKTKVLSSFAHRELSLDQIVAVLNPSRSGKSASLFSATFTHATATHDSVSAGALKFTPIPAAPPHAKVDLSLYISGSIQNRVCHLEYRRDLFHQATIQMWLRHFEGILTQIASDPKSELRLLSPAGLNPILPGSKTTGSNFPKEKTSSQPIVDRAQPATSKTAASKNSNDAAITCVEEKLARIWREALKIDSIPRDADFFNLGGHSLSAMVALAKINAEFAAKVSLGVFLENRTIASLAAWIAKPTATGSKCLIQLRQGDASPPLFLVHAHTGRPLYYMPLVRTLETPRAIYGFQSRALEHGDEEADLKAIASRYIQELKKIQPKGPYHLWGQCFGGILAFEMARQLIKASETVRFLGILESYSPDFSRDRRARPFLTRAITKTLTRAHFEFHVAFQVDRAETLIRYKDRVGRYVTAVRCKIGRRAETSSAGGRSPADQTSHLIESYRTAIGSYYPEAYDGPLTLFRAKAQPVGVNGDPSQGWSRFVKGPINIHTIPGHNTTLLAQPHVKIVAERLSRDLSSSTASD